MKSLVGIPPSQVLPHGPTKLLVDEFIWHSPKVGVVACYTPKKHDVHDHFGVFRGVDQIESFGQATVVSCGAFLECQKRNISFEELFEMYNSAFLQVASVKFCNFVQLGDKYINIGIIKFYKFKQMVVDGRIYKVPNALDLYEYFKEFTEDQLVNYELGNGFQLISEINGITGKGIKKEKFNIRRN